MDTTLHDPPPPFGRGGPHLGRTLDGRYRVEQRVASGGMATVYRGLDLRLDRIVALKVMHPQFAADPEFVERFIREAKSVARLSHPNVVNVFDQGEDRTAAPPVVFLAMEYVPGWTLHDLLRDRGALSVRTTLDILEPVLAALGSAHRAGLVHRDVKPENVLLTEDGRVKVADFGLVRAVDAQTAATTQQVLGTVSYLAPEQIERGAADPRTDVYAAGVMLYEMLTGAKPYTGESPAQVIYRHLSEDVPPPSQRVPGLPHQLDAITQSATSRDPQYRPQDAVDLLAILQQARRELTPDQLDAVPQAAAAVPQTVPVVEQTSVMPPLEGLNQLPPDFVMPRREAPEPAPVPRRASAPARRPRWALPVGALVLVVALVAGLTWALNGGLYTRMPSVLNLPSARAVAQLEQAGLSVNTRQDFSETVSAGLVISSDPQPGARVRKDATVSIDVSKGPNRPTVPDVSGKTVAQATAALQAVGLAVGSSSQQQASDSVPAGRVVGTDPPSGRKLSPNSPVNLIVSSGSEPVDLPDVTGEPVDQATSELQDAGFTVRLDPNQVYSDQDAGTVAAQSPNGSTAQKGATVTLTISKGQEQVDVPDVGGMTAKEARRTLERAGFQVRAITVIPLGKPTVHNQSPGANSQAAKGSTVTLWLYP